MARKASVAWRDCSASSRVMLGPTVPRCAMRMLLRTDGCKGAPSTRPSGTAGGAMRAGPVHAASSVNAFARQIAGEYARVGQKSRVACNTLHASNTLRPLMREGKTQAQQGAEYKQVSNMKRELGFGKSATFHLSGSWPDMLSSKSHLWGYDRGPTQGGQQRRRWG